MIQNYLYKVSLNPKPNKSGAFKESNIGCGMSIFMTSYFLSIYLPMLKKNNSISDVLLQNTKYEKTFLLYCVLLQVTRNI